MIDPTERGAAQQPAGPRAGVRGGGEFLYISTPRPSQFSLGLARLLTNLSDRFDWPKCQVAQATAERDETWKGLVEQLQKENEGLTREAAGMLFPHQVHTHPL